MLLNVLSEPEKPSLSDLSSTDLKSPASEWDSLTPKATITLNILRNLRVNPRLSAHAYHHINFDFNDTPTPLPVTRVLIHSKYTT